MSERFTDRKYRHALTETPHPYNQGKHEPRKMREVMIATKGTLWRCSCGSESHTDDPHKCAVCRGHGCKDWDKRCSMCGRPEHDDNCDCCPECEGSGEIEKEEP